MGPSYKLYYKMPTIYELPSASGIYWTRNLRAQKLGFPERLRATSGPLLMWLFCSYYYFSPATHFQRAGNGLIINILWRNLNVIMQLNFMFLYFCLILVEFCFYYRCFIMRCFIRFFTWFITFSWENNMQRKKTSQYQHISQCSKKTSHQLYAIAKRKLDCYTTSTK